MQVYQNYDRTTHQGTMLTGRDAISTAQSLDGLKFGQTVVFASCEFGQGSGVEARAAANANGGMVIAADGFVRSPSTDKGYQAGNPVTLTVNSDINGRGSAGAFRVFMPNSQGPVPNVSITTMTYDPKSGAFSATVVTGTGDNQQTHTVDNLEKIRNFVE